VTGLTCHGTRTRRQADQASGAGPSQSGIDGQWRARKTTGRTDRAGALRLVYTADGVSISRSKEIADCAIGHKLPTIFALRQNVEAGGFLSYAARLSDLSRRAAFFIDRILKGTKPADIPIEQPTTFERVINMKTAKALGLTSPPLLRALADDVIE
jgi:ABC-type uncharacterized transport system substrate-binding protein